MDESSDVTYKNIRDSAYRNTGVCNRNAADFRFRSSSGRSWKDFLGYYDFTDIFNTAQCDCSYTSSDQNLETAAGIA